VLDAHLVERRIAESYRYRRHDRITPGNVVMINARSGLTRTELSRGRWTTAAASGILALLGTLQSVNSGLGAGPQRRSASMTNGLIPPDAESANPNLDRTSAARPTTAGKGFTWALVVVALLVVGGLAAWQGYRSGDSRSHLHWHVGSASSFSQQISAAADGWAYDIPLDVPWMDRSGTYNEGSRPACLPESRLPIAKVRFAEIRYHLNGGEARQVVLVDCAVGS